MSGRQTAIEVRGLSKSFRIPTHRKDTLKERVLKPFAPAEYRELHALRDVSFEVGQGEFFGIVGRNGSGKSTLLKLLASIYRADAGQIRVAGSIAPFIELAVGFNLEFTAYDNVLLNGVMMGLTRKEAAQRYDAVIEFAELEEFGDLKLKNYSSGMLTRLAFALMVQVDADVMLIDEVLAVGDENFQRKCGEVFMELRGKRTIVFVTHDMTAVERYCHRAMLIDHGIVKEIGEPTRVARDYIDVNASALPAATPGEGGFAAVWVEDAAGERPFTLSHGEEISFNAIVVAPREVNRPRFSFAVKNAAGAWVFTLPYRPAAAGPGDRLEAGERVRLRATLRNPLAGGQFTVQAALTSADRGDELVAVADDAVTVVVEGPGPDGSLLAIDSELATESSATEEVEAR
jgi:ABC-type polysaccharide/polyol phosphate transport system ATPase subunit